MKSLFYYTFKKNAEGEYVYIFVYT